MIGALTPYLSKIRRSYQSNDIIDRLNYQYTAIMLSFAAITLAATQYVGKPIQCWVPPEFTGAWEKLNLSNLTNQKNKLGSNFMSNNFISE
uniref:Innexin n=1 Tax=Meloidogyne incognita TaxID=6306 RepID=A0A914NW81_MELIC